MSLLKRVLIAVVRSVWFLRPIYETARTACPVNHKYFFFQKVLGFNRRVPWPVHFTSVVSGHEFISIGINTAPGASLGNYIFAKEDAPIVVGDFTTVASNVCLGAFNHDVYDISRYVSKGGIQIGRYCWIGANAVVLSGVKLGDHTVVAAGAVVTQSCEEGFAVLAGNPARVVKRLDKERVVAFGHPWHYRGYTKVR